MRLSKKGEYALRALIDLGIAREVDRELVQLTELADNQQLPVKFLEQIMLELREAGFVESRRGRFGGHCLAVPAKSITMGQVIRALEGPLAPIACVSQTAYARCTCPDEDHCGLRMLMMDVRNAIAGILDRYSLADVVEVTLRKLRRDGLPLPFSQPPPRNGARVSPAVRTSNAARARSRDAAASIVNSLLEDFSI